MRVVFYEYNSIVVFHKLLVEILLIKMGITKIMPIYYLADLLLIEINSVVFYSC
jgi:hypothetical protein